MNQNQSMGPNLKTGLTTEQVQKRLRTGRVNTPVESPSKTVSEIVRSNVFTYFNLVFSVLAILLILAGSFRDLTFMIVIIANTVIGIVQELRSKKVLDKLSMLNAPRTSVLRDGKVSTIPSSELVLDDVVIFTAGNQIPADAEVVDGQVQVNESLLTGEADEITKSKGDELLSGSFIVGGKCYARLTRVGEDSYISKLTLEAKRQKPKAPTEMIRSLNKLVLIAGILIIPIGITLFTQQFIIEGAGFRASVTSMVAAVIGMIPEGLFLLASVALVVSVMRLAQKNVLVHDMKCIETLARVDVLCVDKTGTITENNMVVEGVLPLTKPADPVPVTDTDNKATTDSAGTTVAKAESGNTEMVKTAGGEMTATEPDKETETVTEAAADAETVACVEKITAFAAAMEADNATMKALKAHFKGNVTAKAKQVRPFSSVHKYSAVTFEDDTTLVLGAPEFVLRDDFDKYADQVTANSEKGYRVLIFGQYPEDPEGQALTKPFTPLCLILLGNKIRPEAPDTFRYFAEQGVNVKVISGDNPLTVAEVAGKAGIPDADQAVDARTLVTMGQIREAVSRYTVFGRVTPDQKRQLVKALQEAGHTVAMTGDGVNDVLALKDADCSIAMASGSDAAAQTSDLVLLDSQFSGLPSVVAEGRRVVNNITRSASLFLVKNIFSLLLALFSIYFMLDYPMKPAQISLISMFTIGMPGFFLAMQPNINRIQGRFILNVIMAALPAGLTDALMVAGLVIFGKAFEVDPTDISTAATLLLAVVGLLILYRVSKPLNFFRTMILILSAVGMAVCIYFVNDLFAITGISVQCAMLLAVFAIAAEPVMRFFTFLVKIISRACGTIYGKFKKADKAS
ncbi:MAG: cation-translocating P-type ATPase [Lachnospiraceae bacterium]|nr:cation-translocating P-type ATPase [Lachnospiraceae bacterium]